MTMHEQIRQSITYPPYQELTSNDYLMLIFAAFGTDYLPSLQKDQFAKLKDMGLVRKGASIDRPMETNTHILTCVTEQGRAAAFLYFQQMLVTIEKHDSDPT